MSDDENGSFCSRDFNLKAARWRKLYDVDSEKRSGIRVPLDDIDFLVFWVRDSEMRKGFCLCYLFLLFTIPSW